MKSFETGSFIFTFTMIFPWGNKRRFNSYVHHLKDLYGERVQKLSIDAGFTCPNRDGTLGITGCLFCNNDAFNPSYCNPSKPIEQQIIEGIEFHAKRYRRADKFLAYFQAYSNTYKALDELKNIYGEALRNDNIIGLVIGTRPDCIDDRKLEYFRELSKKYYVIIEYGIESCYNKTLERINRGHSFEASAEAIVKTAEMGIKTGAHLIFGLPGESREEMLNEADIISELPLNNIKFHQLQIIKNTAFADKYKRNPENFDLFSMNDYLDFIVRFLERLNPLILIERFAGEVPPRFLAGAGWGLIRNDQFLSLLEKKLEELDTWQGKLFRG